MESFRSMGKTHRNGPARVSSRLFLYALQILSLLLLSAAPTPAPAVNVLTQHNDNFRTGANLSEFILSVSNVNTGQFGKLFSRAVDGQIYAQPLYVNGLVISNKLRNVVYVATEHNSVYAFDADDPAASNALWHVNFGPSVPIADIDGCDDLTPEIGITSTPVIDLTSTSMYVSAKTREIAGSVTNYFHRLHALDLLTGSEHFGGPVAIQGSVPGNAKGSNTGTLTFDPLFSHNRAGLLLVSNVIYEAFGSHCDFSDYHGWMFGYNATNLQRTAILCTTPNGGAQSVGGGIWGSGMGPSADADGYIYVTTGNGNFSINTGGTELSDCFLKLTASNGTFAVADWFAPHDQGFLGSNDLDVAAGGPVVLPNTNLVVGIGKAGEVYLLNRHHLGGYVTFSSDTNIAQEFLAFDQPYFIGQSPVYWKGPTNEFLYFWPNGMPLTAYSFNGALITTNPVATGSTTQILGRAGGISLSANTNAPGSGILWGTVDSNSVLYAYDAGNVAHELWNSQQLPARDALVRSAKFCAPTIANGKVYAATFSSNLVVYGLLAPVQGVSPSTYNFGTLATGTTTQTTFVVTDFGGGPLTGTVATAGPFAVVSGGSYTVTSAGSTNVVLSFTPSSPGSFTNNVIFTSNGGVSTNLVTGTAVAPPNLSVSPGSFNYGSLVIGQTSNQLFSVINTGGLALTGSATVAGAPYSITAGNPFNVAPGQTQTVTVAFAPVAAGTFSTNLIFASNGGASTNALTGIGVTPAQLAVSPSSRNFGGIATGDVAYASFTATNSGGAPLSGTATVGLPFAVVTNASFSLAGFQSTNVVVQFAPTITGTWTSNVVFATTAGSSTNAVSGTGLTPGRIAVSPATLNFGTLVTGATAQASFVVTNSGGIAVTNGTAIASGGPFTIVSGATFSVSGLGFTNVAVSFAPVSPGGFTNIVVFATANGGNATNTVIGAGAIPPTAGFTASPIAGTEPLGVIFSDTSTGTQPLTLVWNLGDSVLVTNSGSANFNHTYAAGTYTVALTASNAFGTSALVSNNLISVLTALQAWQLHYFSCTNCSQAQPDADPLGTGMSNTNKFLAGFNPANPAAYLHVISVANTNSTDISVMYLGANGDNTWSPGIASRTNVLEFTAGAADGGYTNNFASANVTNILSGGTGTGLVTNMLDAGGATNSPSRYYRIRVLVP
jgi:PKD repeat protein